MSASWFTVTQSKFEYLFTLLKGVFDTKADSSHTHTKSEITDFAHDHPLSIEAASTATSAINLDPNAIYKLTAGGKTFIFKTPADSDHYAWADITGKPSSYPPSAHTHTVSQITDFPSTMPPSSHTHGNIQNGGTLQTNDVAIANGDKLVVTDSSDSSKIARASIAFDGSTATKCLTQKGTWENFTNNAGTVTSVKVGSTSYSPASGVVSLPAYPTTAEKLSTARNIALNANFSGGANFDGSANITIDSDFYSCAVNSGNKANYPWHRIAYCSGKTGQYTDVEAVFDISQTFEGGGYGRIKVTLRTNSNGGAVSVGARWIYRVGFDQDLVKIAYWGTTGQSVYADIFFRCGTYARISIQQVRGKRAWTLVNSNEVNDTTASDPKTSTECWATIEAAGTALHNQAYTNIVAGWDAGTVNYAKVAEKVYDVNGSNLTTFAYSKAGLATGDYSWMAAWNGYELRAVDKKQFVRVTNSNNFNQADNYSVNDLAKEHFAMAMFNNATDNPQGAKKWCHGISMAWGNVNTSWVSQIALGVEGSNGLWYRTTQGTVVGASWKRVWDSSNLTNLNQLTNGPGYITGITKSMVTSALGYTPPTSDTNNAVTQTATDSTNSDYEVLFSGTADNTTRTEGARKSSRLYFNPNYGTFTIKNNSLDAFSVHTNANQSDTLEHTAQVTIGNSTANGTAGNATGQLSIYGSGAYCGSIVPGTLTANRTFTLPDKTGTIALTSDIVNTKVTQIGSDGSSFNSAYELLFSATADSTTRTEEARKSSRLKFNPYAGKLFIHNAGDKGCFTLDAEAYTVSTSATAAMLTIGNNTASGTAGNRFGRIRLYSRKSGYVDLEAADNTSKYTATLQAKTGTIALTSDVTADTRPSTTAEPIACNTSSSYPYVAVQVPPGATAGKVISIARLGINDVTYNQNLVMSTSSTTGAKLAYFVLNASDCGAWNGIAYISWTY